MKLSEVIRYINSALNYPALTYPDISLFFDMAISELNTTLHTSIPLVSKMIAEFRQNMSKEDKDKVILTSDPADSNFLLPVDPVDPLDNDVQCYYSETSHSYFVLNQHTQEYSEHKELKGIFVDEDAKPHLYQAINYGSSAAWAEIPTDPDFEAELGFYLPDDWIMLWLIPYVCFKYTVRDGGTAQSFAEELTQGFQQLQETYNVPDRVILATYADRPAYKDLVEKHLPVLNLAVPTVAIYDDMKHSRNTNAIFGSFYDRGGF